MPEGKDNVESVRVDPKTGEVWRDANDFFKQMSKREDTKQGGDFAEIKAQMETAPDGRNSVSEPVRDTRGIKEITRSDYVGRLGGGTPKETFKTGPGRPKSGQSPRKF